MILEGSCLEELWWNCWLVGKGGLAVHRVNIVEDDPLACLLWCIWSERNDQSFEDKETTVADLMFFFLKFLKKPLSLDNCSVLLFYF